MPLNFNFTAVETRLGADAYVKVTTHPDDWEKPTDQQRFAPVTDALIWASIMLGFNEITEANYKKLARRMAAYETAFGDWLKSKEPIEFPGGQKVRITERDFFLHIGLTTNATVKSDKQFQRHIGRILMEEAKPDAERSLTEAVATKSTGMEVTIKIPQDTPADEEG